MRRQKFRVLLISNERSNTNRTQFVLTHNQWGCWLLNGSNGSIQLVHGVNWFQFSDSEDLTKNYPAGELHASKLSFRMRTSFNIVRNYVTLTTGVSCLDCSHHVTSIRAIIHCNINLFKNNGNIKPVPYLANRFAESLQLWKRRVTVKSIQYNIHVAWIMFLLAHVIIKTDRMKWTYLPTDVRVK